MHWIINGKYTALTRAVIVSVDRPQPGFAGASGFTISYRASASLLLTRRSDRGR